ncbi:MAG: hypothetical protein L6W00_21945 [Lentisphaeria bacterium]|nr:MAG: hypothetical protein L6W00_21945 [Lentisphaeria bacterium]
MVLRTFGAEELVIRPAGGRVIIQDNRKVSQKNDTVSVMFCFQPEGGEVSRAELKLNMTVRKIAGVPVPLEKFVTRAFREEPGNTLPVWTLQGPEESLYMIRPGTISALGLDFTVSPRGAAAVGGEKRGAQPELTIPVKVPAGMRSLNFLHTSRVDADGEVRRTRHPVFRWKREPLPTLRPARLRQLDRLTQSGKRRRRLARRPGGQQRLRLSLHLPAAGKPDASRRHAARHPSAGDLVRAGHDLYAGEDPAALPQESPHPHRRRS